MWLNIIAVVVTSHMHFAHFFQCLLCPFFFPLRHWDQCGWRWIRVIGTANPSCPPDIASFIVRPSIVPSFYQFIRFNYDPQKYKEQEEGPTRAWSRWSEAGQKQSLKQFPVLNSILQTLTFLYNLLQFNQYDFFFFKQKVCSVLSSNPKGEEIFNEYDKTKTLPDPTRWQMVNILVADMIESHG